MRPEKNLKSAQHHWWPQTLSKYWADDAGGVHRLSPDGTVIRSQPKRFGTVKNAHHIKLGTPESPSPWDETFEPKFGMADGAIRGLVSWLESLADTLLPTSLPLDKRIAPAVATNDQFATCVECLISLVVRSPRFRASIRRTTEHYRQCFGMKDYEAEDSLIGLNQRDCQNLFVRRLAGRGKIAVLVSNGTEFIFGDGFFHNFTSSSDTPTHPRIVVPLTPTISMFYAKPLSYFSEPRVATISLINNEVKFLNNTSQIYSKNELFYRSDKPELLDEFKGVEYLEYENNSHPAFNMLEHAVTQMRSP